MSSESISSFLVVALGFAVAGLMSTGFQLVTRRPASFQMLDGGAGPATFAAVPFLALAAPFIIMRNTLCGRPMAPRRFEVVMLGTVVASFWSMMSGTVLVMALQALEQILG
jgi:hypothetical protein